MSQIKLADRGPSEPPRRGSREAVGGERPAGDPAGPGALGAAGSACPVAFLCPPQAVAALARDGGPEVGGAGAFLEALLKYGPGGGLTAVVPGLPDVGALARARDRVVAGGRPRRRLQLVLRSSFVETFFSGHRESVLQAFGPLEARYAWARRHRGPDAFALSGLVSTFAGPDVARLLADLITAPFEPYDALICATEATAAAVRTAAEAFAADLRERLGGSPRLRPRIATIPPGIDTEAIRPATADERALRRKELGIAEDEAVVLALGPLTFHGAAHPFPLFDGLSRAARRHGRRVRLIVAGRSPGAKAARTYRDGARVFAANLRVTVLDDPGPADQRAVWQAADLFAAPTDGIRHPAAPALVEAMARGLPVVASDWLGNRELLGDDAGLLVPTRRLPGAVADTATRWLVDEIDADHFLGECNQSTVVDLAASAEAFGRLLADPGLRRQMGAAGRSRAVESFGWPAVLRSYERLWAEQEAERRSRASRGGDRPAATTPPACVPDPETACASFAAAVVGAADRLVADEHARERLDWLLKLPLTSYAAGRRVTDTAALRELLGFAAEGRRLDAFDGHFADRGVAPTTGRATIAWLLKYGLLAPDTEPDAGGGDG